MDTLFRGNVPLPVYTKLAESPECLKVTGCGGALILGCSEPHIAEGSPDWVFEVA